VLHVSVPPVSVAAETARNRNTIYVACRLVDPLHWMIHVQRWPAAPVSHYLRSVDTSAEDQVPESLL